MHVGDCSGQYSANPTESVTIASTSYVLVGLIPSVVLLLINMISVVVAVLVARRCCTKVPQQNSSSKEENTYEQVA